jgi:LytS/YehU family sensor histidine kinase
VENSIKHAISKSEDGGTISISVTVDNNELKIELCDSGKNVYNDINVGQLKKSRSIGIKNTKARLDAIYPDQYSMQYELEEHGQFKTHIRIPYLLANIDNA